MNEDSVELIDIGGLLSMVMSLPLTSILMPLRFLIGVLFFPLIVMSVPLKVIEQEPEPDVLHWWVALVLLLLMVHPGSVTWLTFAGLSNCR